MASLTTETFRATASPGPTSDDRGGAMSMTEGERGSAELCREHVARARASLGLCLEALSKPAPDWDAAARRADCAVACVAVLASRIQDMRAGQAQLPPGCRRPGGAANALPDGQGEKMGETEQSGSSRRV